MSEIPTIRRLNPYSVDWLKVRHEAGQHISPDDVIRIVEFDRTATADPMVCEYLLRAARGELKKKPGRPRRGSAGEFKLLLAAEKVEMLTRWYRRAKARGYRYAYVNKDRIDLSTHVHELVARKMRMGSGRSLQVAISQQKRRPYFAD
jgi:Holliday junction resolvase